MTGPACAAEQRDAAGRPKNDEGENTWGGLAEEVRYWGNWVLEKVRAEIGDLYPLIPDPECSESRLQAAGATKAQSASEPPSTQPAKAGTPNDPFADPQAVMGFADDPEQRLKARTGFLTPVAYARRT